MLKRPLAVLAALLLLLASVLLARALTLRPPQGPAEEGLAAAPEPLAVDAEAAAGRLAAALRLRTVAASDGVAAEEEAFVALHALLARQYPRVHATLRREAVGWQSALFTWEGTEPGLAPVLLMAHLDVVPVEAGTEGRWTHPPFGGVVADGHVWGRGALDDKGPALALLEAVEALLAAGERPRRTVLLALGADEEVGGRQGAQRVAELLASRGVRLASVLDEGGSLVSGAVPGVAAPVALVGVAEKGFVSVELAAEARGGHSSMPPRSTAAGVVARAAARLEAQRPAPRLEGATEALFAHVAPQMPLGLRLLFANTWLLRPLLLRQLASQPTTDATVRTTTALTVLEAGQKDNVLPSRARAVVNFRILPGDSVEGVLAHVRETVDDPAVQVRAVGFSSEPSPVSATDTPAWGGLSRAVRQVFPDAVVAPYLVVGATDARHFAGLSDAVYRFAPLRLAREDLARMHGTDERVSVAGHADAVRFYAQYLRNAAR
jgi:carboxypeptidase PM20D1